MDNNSGLAMVSSQPLGLLVRRLTSSDLGLFHAKRPEILSKQRALNINATIVSRFLDSTFIAAGAATVLCKRVGESGARIERSLLKSGKNWRLGGPAIRDADLSNVSAGDVFLGELRRDQIGAYLLDWQVVRQASDEQSLAKLLTLLKDTLEDGMRFEPTVSPFYDQLYSFMSGGPTAGSNPSRRFDIPPPPRALTFQLEQKARRRTVRERLRSPHVMEEMLQLSAGLSGPAQYEFFDAVTGLAEELREVLDAHQLILQVPKNHKKAWNTVRHKLIAHVDGGVANIPALGAAPIAIRVGTYLVRPGRTGDDREKFEITPQLVDELFASAGSGIFNGLYPDMGAVRDAARMATEAAGAIAAIEEHQDIDYLLLHGALVNPVSRYSDMDDDDGQKIPFPEFSKTALSKLLPFVNPAPEGEDAQFIPVYLQQLEYLENSSATICGVVERPGVSTAVSSALLDIMPDHTLAPHIAEEPARWRETFRKTLKQLGISDPLLFRCVLEEGEATLPVAVDRNETRKAPPKWRLNGTIGKYPKPYVSYLLPSSWAGTIRAEVFEKSIDEFPDIASLLMHSSMLLPGYAFPVGLDTADKVAKIPNWMGRPVTARTMVIAYKKALDSGNSKQIDALRQLMCGTERDFFFRPKP